MNNHTPFRMKKFEVLEEGVELSGGGNMQKVRGLKYSAPNINVYVLKIFTAFSLKKFTL